MRRSILITALLVVWPTALYAADVVDIAFPVDGQVSFTDDFADERGGGRTHEATDILAEKMTRVVAVVDGRIAFAPMEEPSYGYLISLRGDDDYTYTYIHLNNDTPGTDDGLGGPENAYAEGIEEGARVERGEHIAWVGDSGNAEETVSHLHFEMRDADDNVVNPYESLLAAYGDISYDPELETELAVSVNVDQDIQPATGEVFCESDSLIRTDEFTTVYYCGQDGARYVFQNESTFFSWYDGFDDVQFISREEMAATPLRGVVTYRPGTYMVKLLSDPKIYAVARNGTLRWIPSPEIVESLYGTDWPAYVRDLPDGFFPAYQVGEPVLTD